MNIQFKVMLLLIALPALAFAQQHPRFMVVKVGPFPPAADILLNQAVQLINQELFSDAFRQQVEQAHMLGRKLDGYRLTPIEVYARITHPNHNGNIIIRVAVDQSDKGNEVGVTTFRYSAAGNDTLTTTHLTYITTNGAACYAAQLVHEYCHWAGFTHPWSNKLSFGRQKRYVPYVVDGLFAKRLNALCP